MTCEEIGNRKSLKSAINRLFSSKGGVFWRNVRDAQLDEFMMQQIEAWLAKPKAQQNWKKACLTLGRQPDGTYVLNRNVQVRIASYFTVGHAPLFDTPLFLRFVKIS